MAVVGAGPVGLGLALHAAQQLPWLDITLFDARPLTIDVSRDPRTLALSLGSVHLLRRLKAWDAAAAQPIAEVHVSQQPPSWNPLGGEPVVHIRAADEGVEMLGAVLTHGRLVAHLQAAWLARAAQEPQRLHSSFGAPVSALKPLVDGVEIDAGVAERFDLAVIAEGGVFNPRAAAPGASTAPAAEAARWLGARRPLRHDYRQTAWVGQVTLQGAPAGVAFERFSRSGPIALLPLAPGSTAAREPPAGPSRAALVWCVASDDDPLAALDDAQRIEVLNAHIHPHAGRVVAITPLKRFDLGLQAERTLVDGRCVRIGNAAQMLHPVAGQGLNLGLRDAFELVRLFQARPDAAAIDAVLRHVERHRALDRWAMIAATDFLARTFTWPLPGLGAARGLGMAMLQAAGPLKSMLARQMMFGRR